MKEKCKLLEQLSLAQKEATYKNLDRDKSQLEDELLLLEKKLEEGRAKHYEQDQLAKTTLRIFEINEERLKGEIKDTWNENSQLQESQKQLLQEAEVMKEEADELNKQKVTLEESKVQAEQVLNDKENQIMGEMWTKRGAFHLTFPQELGSSSHPTSRKKK